MNFPVKVVLPQGYYTSAMGDPIPWFDPEHRATVLFLHADRSVTWALCDKDGNDITDPSEETP